MVKKKATGKYVPWNKGREMGQRAPLSPAQVTRIKKLLAKRGDAGRRDLALFSTAIDTMLRAQDLLGLRVKDVRKRNRAMRDTFELVITTYGTSVQCVLSKATRNALERWIEQSAKKPGDYLFTGRLGGGLTPMSARQLSRVITTWTTGIGLDSSSYGIESLRRTRAIYILDKTANLEAVRIMLGVKSIGATAQYLSDAKPVNALAINRAHEI